MAPRRPRIAHIPMMPATRNRIAMCMHASAEALVLAPSSAAVTEAAKQLAIITCAVDFVAGAGDMRESASWEAIKVALAAMESIEARHDAGDGWSVTEAEASTLRAASAQFDHVLRLIPFNVYRAAEVFVDGLDEMPQVICSPAMSTAAT